MTGDHRLRRLELRRAAHRAVEAGDGAADLPDVNRFLDELGLPAVDLLETTDVLILLAHYETVHAGRQAEAAEGWANLRDIAPA